MLIYDITPSETFYTNQLVIIYVAPSVSSFGYIRANVLRSLTPSTSLKLRPASL